MVSAKEREFSFEKIVPTPKPLLKENAMGLVNPLVENDEEAVKKVQKNLEKYGADSWYTWRLENWGTKWDTANPEIIYEEDNEIQYQFETAWSPPVPAIRNLSSAFPNLKFYLFFEEEGMGFYGAVRIVNGEVEEEKAAEPMPYIENEGEDAYYERQEKWREEAEAELDKVFDND